MSRCHSTRDRAMWLVEQGCSVIPLQPRSKRPCADLLPVVDGSPSWRPFQTRRATSKEVEGWFQRIPDINIGLVCGAISGVVCVDVDGEKGHEWFKATMPRPNLFQFTSSQHKFHGFYRHPGGSVVIPPSVKGVADEIDIRGDGSYCVFSPSIHPDTGKPYVLRELEGFTGMDSLCPVPDLQLEKKGDGYALKDQQILTTAAALDMEEIPMGERDSRLTSLCARWYALRLDAREISILAHAVNASKCKPPLPEQQVDKIIRSIGKTHGNAHPLAVNVGGLSSWVKLQGDGAFTVNDVFQQLAIKFPDDKARVLVQLEGLRQRGEIEPVGKRAGTYRRVDHSLEEIDLSEKQSDTVIPLRLMFGLENCLRIQPKNIILIAGESNSGKTAFLFNICRQNTGMKFRYITSEMTAEEINGRIKRFGDTREQWASFCKFYSKTHDYADAIDPAGINIIDFLEVYEDFYKVGADIKKIFDRLTTGIAIIAMQKKRGETYARGGEFTIEKARLAISLFTHGRTDDGIIGSCQVVKCKNYKAGKNPEGREYFYMLTHGHHYENEVPGLFSSRDTRFSAEQRKRTLQHIDQYCRAHSRKDEIGEDIDAYGYLRDIDTVPY